MDSLHALESFVSHLPIDHAVVVKWWQRGQWVAHGDPVNIYQRWSNGTLIDARFIGARECADRVAVLYRPYEDAVFVISAEDIIGTLSNFLIKGEYTNGKKIYSR